MLCGDDDLAAAKGYISEMHRVLRSGMYVNIRVRVRVSGQYGQWPHLRQYTNRNLKFGIKQSFSLFLCMRQSGGIFIIVSHGKPEERLELYGTDLNRVSAANKNSDIGNEDDGLWMTKFQIICKCVVT